MSESDADFVERMASVVREGTPFNADARQFERLIAIARRSAAPAPAGDAVERVAEAIRAWFEKHGWNLDALARAALAAIPESEHSVAEASDGVTQADLEEWLRRAREQAPHHDRAEAELFAELDRMAAETRGMMRERERCAGIARKQAEEAKDDVRGNSIGFYAYEACEGIERAISAAASHPAWAGPYDALVEERGAALLHVLENAESNVVDAQISWERVVEIDRELSKIWPMEAGREDGWLPMDSAPKDRTKIDVWTWWPEHDRYDRTPDAYYDADQQDWWLKGTFREAYAYPPKLMFWRPLPFAPRPREGEASS